MNLYIPKEEDRLSIRYIPLALTVAADFRHIALAKGIDYQDIQGVALLALVEAENAFDNSSPFQNFMPMAVRRSIMRHLNKKSERDAALAISLEGYVAAKGAYLHPQTEEDFAWSYIIGDEVLGFEEDFLAIAFYDELAHFFELLSEKERYLIHLRILEFRQKECVDLIKKRFHTTCSQGTVSTMLATIRQKYNEYRAA